MEVCSETSAKVTPDIREMKAGEELGNVGEEGLAGPTEASHFFHALIPGTSD